VVYITTADLLRLAERDEAVRKAIALYLAEKAEKRHAETEGNCRKILKRHPSFLDPAAGGRHLKLAMKKTSRQLRQVLNYTLNSLDVRCQPGQA
jgi:hypothetical protein